MVEKNLKKTDNFDFKQIISLNCASTVCTKNNY